MPRDDAAASALDRTIRAARARITTGRRTRRSPGDDEPGTFLLGVGAQKGGTTWLYDFLSGSEQFSPGFRKEYHVFDGLDLESSAEFKARVLHQGREALEAVDRGEQVSWTPLLRAGFYADPEAYPDYFTSLLHRPGVRVTADVTPAYSMLSEERFRMIREAFERRGVRCVAAFLMRDPVDRVWSAVRMAYRRQPREGGPTAEEHTLEVHRSEAYHLRSRYDLTIARLDAAFGPDLVHYEFYERLFAREATEQLCTFLGIEPHSPQLDKRLNASPTQAVLPTSTVREIADTYRPVYEAVARRFPDVDLHELWPSSRHVL